MPQALQDGSLKLLSSFMTQQQLSTLERQLPAYAGNCQDLVTFLTGISSSGYEFQEQHYGSLALIQKVY